MYNKSGQLLKLGSSLLKKVNISRPQHESRLILSKEMTKDINEIYSNIYLNVSENKKNSFLKKIYQRLEGKPISRILGYREFFSRKFLINKFTLDPRPESEFLVELIIKQIKKIKKKKIRILELGTGSGCLLITILLESKKLGKRISSVGCDICDKSILLAKKNIKVYGLKKEISLIKSNWFSCINEKFDIIFSNPPYIKSKEINDLSKDVKNYDPLISLDGGKDGIECFREISKKINSYLFDNGYFFTEIGINQEHILKYLFFRENMKKTWVYKDFQGIKRNIVFFKEK